MGGERAAVFAQADNRLRLGLGEMGLKRQLVVASKIAAANKKCITAVKRNGRRDRGTDKLAVERPIGIDRLDGAGARLVGSELKGEHLLAQCGRDSVSTAIFSSPPSVSVFFSIVGPDAL